MRNLPTSTSALAKIAEACIALLVIGLGAYVIWNTQDVRIGPKQVGVLLGAGQILIGVWYLFELFVHHRDEERSARIESLLSNTATDWQRLGIIAVGLMAYAVLLERAGFIVASTLLLVISAYGLGSQRLLRDGVSAIVVSSLVFVLFDQVFGVHLPEGWASGVL